MREIQINVNGDIISNDDKWIYDWLEWDSTCPNDIKNALAAKSENEKLTVLVNSGGGSVMAGQEIYSLLSGRSDVEIKVQSLAGSAASVIAMANHCEISPVAMIMIHNVSMSGASGDYHDMQKNAEILRQMNAALAGAYTAKTGRSPVAMIMIHNVSMSGASGDYHDMQKNAEILRQMNAALAGAYTAKTGRSHVAMIMIHNVSMSGASGDYHDMQKNAEILRQMNAALAGAYTAKTGRSQEEILKLMDRETWLTASQALEMGFVDGISSEEARQNYFLNNINGMRLTDEIRQKVLNEKAQAEQNEKMKNDILKDLDLYGV